MTHTPASPPTPAWIVVCITGGVTIAGWFVAHRLIQARENRARRINFVARMCEIRLLASKTGDEDFREGFGAIRVEIEKQCALVEGAIKWCRRKQFAIMRQQCAETRATNDPRP